MNIQILVAIVLAYFAFKTPEKQSSTRIVLWLNPGWSQDELVIAQALNILAEDLESETRLKFGKDWEIRVSIEWSIGIPGVTEMPESMYDADTRTFYFIRHLVDRLNADNQDMLFQMDPATVARDKNFGRHAERALSYFWIDQKSISLGLGSILSLEHVASLTGSEQVGLNIMVEGIVEFFKNAHNPQNRELSEELFPSTKSEWKLYKADAITNDGGLWLVKDILETFGDRGLVWLLKNPFVADINLRKAAIKYRNEAFLWLGVQ